MLLPLQIIFFASSVHNVFALTDRAAARVAVTSNVLHLKTAPNAPHLIPPSSKHLLKLRKARNIASHDNNRRQDEPIADIQETLITLGGRVYMADVTLAGQQFTLVIDSGSSDTWVASSTFQCRNPSTMGSISRDKCGFARLYNPRHSSTWSRMSEEEFGVNYTGGEFLQGELGTEELGIGGVSIGMQPALVVNQTIGVVDDGYWLGDGVSSGLMGLAYPAIVSGAMTLDYKSIMFTLTQQSGIAPIFSLALSRPSLSNPRVGGMLAIGGIPDVEHDGHFVTVPIQPIFEDIYAYYSIDIDGFDITPPSPSTHRLRHGSSTRHSKQQHRQLLVPKIDPADTPVNVILDSGSSLVYLPNNITDYIAALFSPPAKYSASLDLYTVPCSASAPRFGVIIDGRTFYMSEDDLMNRTPGPSSKSARKLCTLAVQRAGQGTLVLGDSWLKNVLVVFDLERNEIKVAGRENY